MTAAAWPDDLTTALKSPKVNVYIDASGSMRPHDATGPFAEAVETVRATLGEKLSRVYSFYHGGVRPIGRTTSRGGGDGLRLALEHARKARRRALVFTDGGNSPLVTTQNWALAHIGGDMAVEYIEANLKPNHIYTVDEPTDREVRAALRRSDGEGIPNDPAGIADRMAKASRAAVEHRMTHQPPTDEACEREQREALNPANVEVPPDRLAALELLAETLLAYRAGTHTQSPAFTLAERVVAEKRERERKADEHNVLCAIVDLRNLTFDDLLDAVRAPRIIRTRSDRPTTKTVDRFREAATTVLAYLDKYGTKENSP